MKSVFVIIAILFCVTATFAYPSEQVLSCKGQLKGKYDELPAFGQKLDLHILQTPKDKNYRWLVKVDAKINVETKTNGPINADGTTIAPNGYENMIYFGQVDSGIVIKKESGALKGQLNYNEESLQSPGEYYPVTYELFNCELSGSPDQREAIIYNAQAELTDLSVVGQESWLNGVAIRAKVSGLAYGLVAYVATEELKNKFIEEFRRRGLVTTSSGRVFYNYKLRNAVMPLDFEIVDIRGAP